MYIKDEHMAILLMQCGCLNDIAEQCRDTKNEIITARQIREVQINIEKILTLYVEKTTQNVEKNTHQ